MAEPNSYEEQRRRQVEENKRKLEELRLHRLSAAVREAAVKPMPIQELKLRYLRPPPPPTRRSGRVASLPKQPDYRDKKAPRAYVNRRGLPPDRVYATDEARDYAFTKAKELNNQLSSAHPSFIKPMTHSYATGSLLTIPRQFKKSYLPRFDEMIFLVDEEDGEFPMPYIAQHGAIGTGWKMFAIGHNLADGDCLVFQQVQRTKFKVYIIRASSYYEKDHC
ncbi:B3 domain-containing protein Os06g0194400-like isoform X1 [Triticum urartu]|uniref:B3 domain-containing protein Os06g0194400-like isoform X1 n=1 Tax=Triticum urartu TaxID=4572 RepID=UPI0020430806|nr:B3 domain-containing protein Os06g0194400-like isoform X1 [Triticum urartu]XP_048560602.1 B3 domain-containing protein Os06g0194400-like isoform X1 [Triticum urartu]